MVLLGTGSCSHGSWDNWLTLFRAGTPVCISRNPSLRAEAWLGEGGEEGKQESGARPRL